MSSIAIGNDRPRGPRTGQAFADRRLRLKVGPIDRPVSLPISIAVALAAIAGAASLRTGIETAGGIHLVPFLFTFPAVIVATMLAGARAGAIAAIGCQLLTIRFVLPNWSIDLGNRADVANLVVSSASLALTIWAAGGARMLSRQLRIRCEREVATMSVLVAEMDHRTKNNFQVAAALLRSQAGECGNADAAFQLGKMAARLGSIAAAYRKLSPARDRATFDLTGYLGELMALLNDGLIPPEVRLKLSGEAIEVDAQTGLMIGLLVNEWVTNAVKFALPAGANLIAVEVVRAGAGCRVVVADNATVAVTLRGAGGGSTLMAQLAHAIGGVIAIEQDHGTRCTLSLPTVV